MARQRKTLTIVSDVTGFTDEEISNLEFEMVVQQEASKDTDDTYKGHPSAGLISVTYGQTTIYDGFTDEEDLDAITHGGTRYFTLIEYNWKREWSSALGVNGEVMVIQGIDNAIGMARFMLGVPEEGDDIAREPRPGMLPFIAFYEHSEDPTGKEDSDELETWGGGWVDLLGNFHDCVHEDDPDLWDAMTRLQTALGPVPDAS